MMDSNELNLKLKSLRGKTIAVVYIFEKEDAPGFEHYWVWKSNIISGWLNAIQEIGCMPLIMVTVNPQSTLPSKEKSS